MQTIRIRITSFRSIVFVIGAVLFGIADNHNPQVLPVAILLVIVANLIWHLYELSRLYGAGKVVADEIDI